MRPSNRQSVPTIPARFWRFKPVQWLITDFMDWLFPFCTVNLLWVVLSLTLILFPPATASLFEVSYRAYRGQAPTSAAFIKGIRRWLIPAWKWASPNLLLIAAAVMLSRSLPDNTLISALIAGVVGLILLAQIYVWPFVMLQEKPRLWQAVRNSLFTVLGDPLLTGMNLVFTAIVLLPSILVIAPILFIIPVVLSLVYTYSLVAWLNHHHILSGSVRDN